jgi:class 3 adenylate cyclase/tetratricopeptide (TPR) repeat protein
MNCPACATPNEAGRKFCAECGTRLAVACGVCGTTNAPGTRFCGECGSPLAVAASAVPAARQADATPDDERTAGGPARVAERRFVSVLFADLVGFTALSEDRDPEEVREFLTRYFETCRSLVGRYGGTIEKFIGDAVMAVWGVPTANEDDAERAVRAALDLTAAVVALGEEIGVPTLRARAGVLSGEAAVTLGATDQGMVAGDLVNSASRVQAAAKPGQVFVGPETKLATEAGIEYEDAGPHELKGKAEAVQLWRAVRVVGLTGGSQRSREIEPPFTGRDPELRVLKQLFHGAADDRRAHLVSVFGVGGIGKSRLAWEFEKYVDGLALEVSWQRGRCLAYGEGVSFWALGEMVRGRAGILEEEDGDTALRKLRATLERFIPDAAERRFVEPRLIQLLGMETRDGGSPGGDQENLFSAWRLFFERLADLGPTVLVFEDLHWADAALIDFIDYVLEWARDKPIFILALARPELLERHPKWGTAKRSLTSLFLEPLGAAHIDALLEGAVTGLPDELRAQIVERSEGIPFYAVETVRMLMDRGLVVKTESGYRPTGPIETLEVPRTLQALVAARLDDLQGVERRVLQDASVLGRTFTIAGLVAVSGLSEPELQPVLNSLVRKEMLSHEIDPLSPERGQYGFLQDIVRRVAYETLSKHDRQPRHLAAAAFLEAQAAGDDDLIEVIASHRLDAYLAAPDGAASDGLRQSARETVVRAGERAASLGSNLAAQRYFERAASLADERAHRANMLERAGMMAFAGARADAASKLYTAALELHEADGAAHAAARVSARRAEIMWDHGRLREALESMDSAFRLLSEDEPDADLASLAAQIGRFAFFGGNSKLGLERTEAALALAESLDLPEVLSNALNTKSLLLTARGRWREGMALLRHALEVALDNDKPSGAIRAYNNLADVYGYSDRYVEAQRQVDDGLLLARRVGDRYWEKVLIGTIYPRYALGDWQGALVAMAELGGLDEQIQSRTAVTQGYVSFGAAIHAHRGDLPAAERLLAAFSDLVDSADSQERMEYACAEAFVASARGDLERAGASAEAAWGQKALGEFDYRVKEAFVLAVEAALGRGDMTHARDLLDRGAVVRSGYRPPFVSAQTSRLEALFEAAQGASDDGYGKLTSAIEIFRQMPFPFWVARTLMDRAEFLAASDRVGEAATDLAESRAIFTQLGAMAWLEKADAIASQLRTAAAPAI